MPAVYKVVHVTHYAYASTVSASQHIAYLRPRQLPHQHVRSHHLDVDPAPAHAIHRRDYFGNTADHFQLLTPHSTLRVTSRSMVDVEDRRGEVAAAASPALAPALRLLAARVAPAVAVFAYASPYAPVVPETEAFARLSFPDGQTVLGGALDLMHRIHDTFRFDPAATRVANPVTRVLAERRGVCQDFAHVHVSSLRSVGIPARYVSGYLLTDPPPGQPRLIGADASHAWVSVFCPHHGWVDLDPTNGVIAGTRHITLAWGRDYGDVSPLHGVLLGGTNHTPRVGVSVIPVEEGVPDS
jgi:transglutaminase-like putative cysteine protease